MRQFSTVADAGASNFEYAKTMDIRERHMKEDDGELGNDLDKFPKGSFQV